MIYRCAVCGMVFQDVTYFNLHRGVHENCMFCGGEHSTPKGLVPSIIPDGVSDSERERLMKLADRPCNLHVT